MKKRLVGIILFASISSYAQNPCSIFVTGIVGKTQVELKNYEGEAIEDYLYTGNVNDEIRVLISESADVPDYTIHIYDRKRGVRLESDKTLRYETGSNGVGEKIVVDANCSRVE